LKVVIGASTFSENNDKPLCLLKNKNVEVIKNPYGRRMTEQEIINHLDGADGLLAGLEPLNETVFFQSPTLKAISRIGIGMDNIDIEAAKNRNIKVSNTPSGPTRAVAEMTLAALLTIARQIVPSNHEMHQRQWNKRMGFSLEGIKVLLVGYGRIGRSVADLLKIFGVEILIYDILNHDLSVKSLEDGLILADVISLHASGNKEIIHSDMFERMKPGVVILNSARGGLINEDGLYNALRTGKVAYFWGDAFWEEPYNGKLTECENAILTPHISTYSKQCRELMEIEAVTNLLRDLGYV
jgi:D-3-phosphoglycerate dehydrogenase